MTPSIKKLRALCEAATLGPWSSDDGNIFSTPLGEKRHAMIMAMMQDRSLPHPDDGRNDPMGFVASTGQDQPNFENDEAFIAATSPDVVGALLDEIEQLRAVIGVASKSDGYWVGVLRDSLKRVGL